MSNLYSEKAYMYCKYCGKPIEKGGNVVIIQDLRDEPEHRNVVDVYTVCKGLCDRQLQRRVMQQGLYDGWEDLDDLRIPVEYIRWLMGILNGLYNGDKYTKEAFENLKTVLLVLAQDICRDMTEKELERVRMLNMLYF